MTFMLLSDKCHLLINNFVMHYCIPSISVIYIFLKFVCIGLRCYTKLFSKRLLLFTPFWAKMNVSDCIFDVRTGNDKGFYYLTWISSAYWKYIAIALSLTNSFQVPPLTILTILNYLVLLKLSQSVQYMYCREKHKN